MDETEKYKKFISDFEKWLKEQKKQVSTVTVERTIKILKMSNDIK